MTSRGRYLVADVAHNMDMSRILNPTEKDFARVSEYEQVRAILLAAGDGL